MQEHHESHFEGQHESSPSVVKIHVNNRDVFLHPGEYHVPTLKQLSGVALADDLDELVACQLQPVGDDAKVHIKGCEIFVSHVKDGGSS